MGSFAVGERNKMLDAAVGRTTYTASAGFFMQLHTGAPGAAGTSNVSSHTARTSVTMGTAASAGAISNTAAIAVTVTLSGPETITDVSFWSASSGGTFLGSDDLSASAALITGDTLNIPIGDLDLTIT